MEMSAGAKECDPVCEGGGVRVARLPCRRDLALGGSTFTAVCVLAVADGGYFPRVWGISILLFWGIALGLLLLPGIELSALEALTLASLAGFVVWIALSVLWSIDPGQSMLEVQRALMYLGGSAAVLIFARRGSAEVVLAALASACVVVSGYALVTGLYPEALGAPTVRRLAVSPLSEPIGYSSALGLLAAIGILLTFGFATRAETSAARALAGAALVPLALTLYFTASRAAVIALAIGFAVAVACDPERREFVVSILPALPLPIMAVGVSAGMEALVKPGVPLEEATRAGNRLALVLIVFAATAATLVWTAIRGQRPHRLRLATLVLAFALVLTVIGRGWVNGGTQVQLQPASPGGARITSRLASMSLHGRAQLWSVAWRATREEPFLGTGAGTFERSWLRFRPARGNLRSAHNLYVETLSELGPVGLGLLLVMLATPLIAAVRIRHTRFVPLAAGAFVAYLVHAGVHWDWEMPVVTLAALACGGAILLAARGEVRARPLRTLVRIGMAGAAAAISGFAFIGLVGNVALEQGIEAAALGSTTTAKDQARRAIYWMPWAGEPWRVFGEVAREEGNIALARASFYQGLERDPDDWMLWADLASTTQGRARLNALEQARNLNPHADEVEQLRGRVLPRREVDMNISPDIVWQKATVQVGATDEHQ